MKDRKYWDTWGRNTLATSRAQDAAKVLNPDHNAATTDETDIFKENQTFTNAVFDKVLQTGRYKKHVRKYERYFDA